MRLSHVDSTSSHLSVNIPSPVKVARHKSTVISTANIEISARSLDDVRLHIIQGMNPDAAIL